MRLVGPSTNLEMSLDEALIKAREAGEDLVEVSPNSIPPVVRIIDFKKFLFEQKKKEKKTDKSRVVLKELRFSPVIAENDLRIRVERAKGFLAAGNPVKVNIHFRGREITHPELGRNKLTQITQLLLDHGKPNAEPKWSGPTLSVIFSPAK